MSVIIIIIINIRGHSVKKMNQQKDNIHKKIMLWFWWDFKGIVGN